MSEILDDKELQLLPTKKFYDQLDKGTDDCQNVNFYITAKHLLNRYSVFQKGYDKILKGICYVYRNNFPDDSDNDICDFLYYWLADILYDNIIPRLEFYSIMPYLFGILRIRNEKKCTAPNYYNFNEEKNFKNIKLFFDYSKDYDTYEKQITNNNLPCNKNYNEYLKKYVVTYNEFKGKCKDGRNTSGYCKAFIDYFSKKNPERLSSWTCNLQKNEPEAKRTSGDTKEKEERSVPESGMEEQHVTLPEGLKGEREQVEEGHSASVNPSREGTAKLNRDSNPTDVTSTSTTTKSIATAASVAGILLPPFLLYNFTPLRSWINKLLGRNQLYRNPLTERELIENSYQSDHLDLDRNRYNISYRPE